MVRWNAVDHNGPIAVKDLFGPSLGMEKDIVQVKIRMSRTLRDKIEAASRTSNRRMNTEILHRLAQSFIPQDSGAGSEDIFNQVIAARQQLRKLLEELQAVKPDEILKAFRENKNIKQVSLGKRKNIK